MNDFATSNTAFNFDLFRELYAAAPDKKLQFSAYSVRRALTMAAIGARTATLEGFLDTFRLPRGTDLARVHKYNQRQLSRLLMAEAKADAPTEISIANALWLKKADELYRFLPQFIADNQQWYNAELTDDLPFDQSTIDKINAWCLLKTKKIPTILSELPRNARAVLTDALYLLTPANKRFYKRNDTTDKFAPLVGDPRDLIYMTNPHGVFNYIASDSVQVLQFPFGKFGAFNYYLVLPDAKSNLDAAVKSLTAGNWAGWLENMDEAEGRFRLPPNEQEFDSELIPVLSNMGLEHAFSDDADFSAMCTGGLKIGGVKHKTYTKFGRIGFEGAAITAVIMCERASAPVKVRKTIDLTANRPYVWFVTGYDEFLFGGTTVDPKQPNGFMDESDVDPAPRFD